MNGIREFILYGVFFSFLFMLPAAYSIADPFGCSSQNITFDGSKWSAEYFQCNVRPDFFNLTVSNATVQNVTFNCTDTDILNAVRNYTDSINHTFYSSLTLYGDLQSQVAEANRSNDNCLGALKICNDNLKQIDAYGNLTTLGNDFNQCKGERDSLNGQIGNSGGLNDQIKILKDTQWQYAIGGFAGGLVICYAYLTQLKKSPPRTELVPSSGTEQVFKEKESRTAMDLAEMRAQLDEMRRKSQEEGEGKHRRAKRG